MRSSTIDNTAARTNAQTHFRPEDARNPPPPRTANAERGRDAAKLARLRALRLARDATEEDERVRLAKENPQRPARLKRVKAKPAAKIRTIY
jgi:hypothetical protein